MKRRFPFSQESTVEKSDQAPRTQLPETQPRQSAGSNKSLHLLLVRDILLPQCTLGKLSINGVFECYTLEDPVRAGPKIAGETAIPAGFYDVQITYSPRFKRMLPLLIDVRGFSGIRIHPGNTAQDTEGCILVGTARDVERGALYNSREAFDRLFAVLLEAKIIDIRIIERRENVA